MWQRQTVRVLKLVIYPQWLKNTKAVVKTAINYQTCWALALQRSNPYPKKTLPAVKAANDVSTIMKLMFNDEVAVVIAATALNATQAPKHGTITKF